MGIKKDKTNLIVRSGFAVIIVLMMALMAVSIYLFDRSNERLQTIVEINNKKIEFASTMRDAIRLRQISLNSMITMTDIEELDNELMRFYGFARPYRESRNQLLALPIDDYERELHKQLTRQVRIAQPINREAAETFMRGTPLDVIIPFVKRAQKEQNTLLSLLDALVLLQKEQAEKSVESGNRFYQKSIRFTVIVGLILIIGTVVIAKYVSKYVSRRNDELINAYKKADEATKAKTRFLSQMSHELRTPMNAVLGFAELIHDDENLTSDQKKFIGDILKAGNHLLELINQILDLARIENNSVGLSMESVCLIDLLQECRKLLIPLAETRDVTLYMGDATCKDKFIHADKLRLKQIFINLISNAIKYNNEGGLVTIQCKRANNGNHHISITDTGPGIPENKMNQLFQPFNRLGAEQTNTEGTGLGLVITKNLVEKMDGSIGAHSAEDGGSIFWVELQRGTFIPNKESTIPDEKPIAQKLGIDDDKKTLLYIEDNMANTRVMKHLIGKIGGYKIINAVTAERGLLMAESYHPDLILMDINLPGMDGYEALKALQKLESTQSVPVIAVSANVMPGDIRKGMDAGFKDYITKPINHEKLKNTLFYYCPTSTKPSLEVVVNQD